MRTPFLNSYNYLESLLNQFRGDLGIADKKKSKFDFFS